MSVCLFFKAWIGAAFSLGFIFGPLLGALSSHLGTIYAPKSPVAFFIVPAIVSLLLSLINIAIVTQFCPETLPVAKRVRLAASCSVFSDACVCSSAFQEAKKTTVDDVCNTILPWRLFKFSAIHNVKSVDGSFAEKGHEHQL